MGRNNDAVHWYIGELTARIVAESGIPSDRHHVGKMILQSLKDAPDFVLQINAGTGESETNGSVLERSIKCAIQLQKHGLKKGDVITLMAPNNLDQAVVMYAALYSGITVSSIDWTMKTGELQATFDFSKPKAIFCLNNKLKDVQEALDNIKSVALVFTYDSGEQAFANLLAKCDDADAIANFKCTEFDPDDTNVFLIATSGTTGLPKAAMATHKNVAIAFVYTYSMFTNFPTPFESAFIISPLQWLTALMHYVFSPIVRITRIQTDQETTIEHAHYVINTYKPRSMIISPTTLTNLTRPDKVDGCDFSCFETMFVGGSAVPPSLLNKMKTLAPELSIVNAFGMSELGGYGLYADKPPKGSSGQPLGHLLYRLIDPTSQEDINEPNKPGELWVKGPSVVKGYYNNEAATKEAFTDDGWFKTGDLFYRDENDYYFFVDRLKLLLKYMNHQISPIELEGVIRQHPGVLEVVVTSVSDPERGDLPVACVKRQKGATITAQEIKDLVKNNLTDTKQLRGGVVFMDDIPLTSTSKIDRKKIKEIVSQSDRQ